MGLDQGVEVGLRLLERGLGLVEDAIRERVLVRVLGAQADAQVAFEDLHVGQDPGLGIGQREQIDRAQGLVELLGLHVRPGHLVEHLVEEGALAIELLVLLDGLGGLAGLVVDAAERQTRQLDDLALLGGLGLRAQDVGERGRGGAVLGLRHPHDAREVVRLEVVGMGLADGVEDGRGVIEIAREVGVLAAHVGHRGIARGLGDGVELAEHVGHAGVLVELEGQLDEAHEALLVVRAGLAELADHVAEVLLRRAQIALVIQRIGQVVERVVEAARLRVLLHQIVEDEAGVLVVLEAVGQLGVDQHALVLLRRVRILARRLQRALDLARLPVGEGELLTGRRDVVGVRGGGHRERSRERERLEAFCEDGHGRHRGRARRLLARRLGCAAFEHDLDVEVDGGALLRAAW